MTTTRLPLVIGSNSRIQQLQPGDVTDPVALATGTPTLGYVPTIGASGWAEWMASDAADVWLPFTYSASDLNTILSGNAVVDFDIYLPTTNQFVETVIIKCTTPFTATSMANIGIGTNVGGSQTVIGPSDLTNSSPNMLNYNLTPDPLYLNDPTRKLIGTISVSSPGDTVAAGTLVVWVKIANLP